MIKPRFLAAVILCASTLILLVGCGNIFDTLVTKTSSYNAEAAKNALESGNYSTAISSATSVINDSSASTSDKTDAYATRAEATVMSELSSDFNTVVSNLSNLTSGSTSFDMSSMVPTNSASAFANAANDLNTAADIGTLTEEQQTLRVITNIGAAAATLDNYIAADGSIEVSGSVTSDVLSQMVSGNILQNLIEAGEAAATVSTSNTLIGGNTAQIVTASIIARRLQALDYAFKNATSLQGADSNSSASNDTGDRDGDVNGDDAFANFVDPTYGTIVETTTVTALNYDPVFQYLAVQLSL